jgi:GNAT superfamily N-acetyltransferase|tara:strand:- start:469 stop:927 length:459 start_codon:yes stop_codon:yes gene_type:complete
MDWRFFEEKDLFWILKASKDMYKESYLEEKGVEFNEEKVKNYFYLALDKPDGFAIIAEDDGEPIGFLISDIGEYAIGKQKIAKNLELYVVPEKRGGKTGLMMMENFIKWAQMNDATEIVFAPSAHDKINKFDAFAKKLGMSATSKVYKRFKI